MSGTETTDALDALVHQFADPMSFLRELVQNSLDAGTPEIDIDFEYQEGKPGQAGVSIIHVDDFGEGMDREIIDTKLTRLFSSSKDGDLTKIGRFGIGFVSVFAIEPDAVCLDTSRGGENWRVLFGRDRTFVRIARDEPVDGTKIRVIKAATPAEHADRRARAREVVTYWCKHARAEILFDGERINAPFTLPGPAVVTHEEEGTRVVASYTEKEQGWFGFYNKGLTLHEGSGEFWPYVAFKVDSRYLEHTLTRDNVLRDDHFAKVHKIVERLVQTDLPARLLGELEARRDAPPDGDRAFLYRALGTLAQRDPDSVWRHRDRAVFPPVAGEAPTLATVRRAARRAELYVCEHPSALARALRDTGAVVLAMTPGTPPARALAALTGDDLRWADAHLCRPEPIDPPTHQRLAPLCDALARLLDAHGARLTQVVVARFAYAGSSILALPAITQAQVGDLTPVSEVRNLPTSIFSRRRALVVNADHPAVAALGAAAQREPELAAYELTKLFFLPGRLTLERDGALAALSITHRRLRTAARRG